MDWKLTALGLFVCLVVGPMMFPPTMMGRNIPKAEDVGVSSKGAAAVYNRCMRHTGPGKNRSFEGRREEACRCVGERYDKRIPDSANFQALNLMDHIFETQRRVGQKFVMLQGFDERSLGKTRFRFAKKTARSVKAILSYCRRSA